MTTSEIIAKLEAIGASLSTAQDKVEDLVIDLQAEQPIEPPVEPPIEPPTEPPAANAIYVHADMSASKVKAIFSALKPGDDVIVEGTGSWVGSFMLPPQPRDSRIVIRGDGTKRPKFAIKMTGSGGIFKIPEHAHGYILRGLDICAEGVHVTSLVDIGGAVTSVAADQPENVVLSDCYIHGDGALGSRRGVTLNGGVGCRVSACVITNIMADVDSQAIGSWNGIGGWIIEDSHLEATGENIMFGGTRGYIQGHVISDIIIRRNTIRKPLTWMSDKNPAGSPKWTIKNLFELKRGKNIRVLENRFENNWVGAHSGFAWVLTVRCEHGANPWNVIDDVLFKDNVVSNVGGALNAMGRDNNSGYAGACRNLRLQNNLFVLNKALGVQGKNRGFQLLTGVENISLENVTLVGDAQTVVTMGIGLDSADASKYPIKELSIKKSIIEGEVKGSGAAVGDASFSKFCRGVDVSGNLWLTAGGPSGNERANRADVLDSSNRPNAKYLTYGWR